MVNRRGAIFNRSLFKYAEISNIECALKELFACGQARALTENDYAAFLLCLPKTALVAGAKAASFADIRSSWSKPKLIEYFFNSVPFTTAFRHCGGDDFVALDNVRPIEFLLYLYFGKVESDLKNFALRDLGIMRT